MQGCRRLRFLRTFQTAILLASILLCPAGRSLADPLPQLAPPEGQVMLTVAGRITRTNAEGRAELDREMLEALGVRELVTSTPWTDGTPLFRGVLAQDLLRHLGAEGKTVRAEALNDYSSEIALTDLETYPVLIAFEMNGQPLQVRDKGPLWIVFPRDQFDELNDRATERKMVWQLKRLVIE